MMGGMRLNSGRTVHKFRHTSPTADDGCGTPHSTAAATVCSCMTMNSADVNCISNPVLRSESTRTLPGCCACSRWQDNAPYVRSRRKKRSRQTAAGGVTVSVSADGVAAASTNESRIVTTYHTVGSDTVASTSGRNTALTCSTTGKCAIATQRFMLNIKPTPASTAAPGDRSSYPHLHNAMLAETAGAQCICNHVVHHALCSSGTVHSGSSSTLREPNSLLDMCVDKIVKSIKTYSENLGRVPHCIQDRILLRLLRRNELTDELFLRCVSTKDRRTLELDGCSRLRKSVLKQQIAYMCPSLLRLELRNFTHVNNRVLQQVLLAAKHLLELKLEGCPLLTDSAFVPRPFELAVGLINLQSLTLSRCPQITDAAVVEVLKAAPQLRSVDFSYCRNVTDLALRSVLGGLNKLTNTNFNYCKRLTPSGAFSELQSGSCPHLAHITLAGTAVDDAAVCRLATAAPALEYLSLKWCRNISDKAVVVLAYCCPALSSISLRSCPGISDNSVYHLLKQCKLTYIDVSYCLGITTWSIELIAAAAWTPPAHHTEAADNTCGDAEHITATSAATADAGTGSGVLLSKVCFSLCTNIKQGSIPRARPVLLPTAIAAAHADDQLSPAHLLPPSNTTNLPTTALDPLRSTVAVGTDTGQALSTSPPGTPSLSTGQDLLHDLPHCRDRRGVQCLSTISTAASSASSSSSTTTCWNTRSHNTTGHNLANTYISGNGNTATHLDDDHGGGLSTVRPNAQAAANYSVSADDSIATHSAAVNMAASRRSPQSASDIACSLAPPPSPPHAPVSATSTTIVRAVPAAVVSPMTDDIWAAMIKRLRNSLQTLKIDGVPPPHSIASIMSQIAKTRGLKSLALSITDLIPPTPTGVYTGTGRMYSGAVHNTSYVDTVRAGERMVCRAKRVRCFYCGVVKRHAGPQTATTAAPQATAAQRAGTGTTMPQRQIVQQPTKQEQRSRSPQGSGTACNGTSSSSSSMLRVPSRPGGQPYVQRRCAYQAGWAEGTASEGSKWTDLEGSSTGGSDHCCCSYCLLPIATGSCHAATSGGGTACAVYAACTSVNGSATDSVSVCGGAICSAACCRFPDSSSIPPRPTAPIVCSTSRKRFMYSGTVPTHSDAAGTQSTRTGDVLLGPCPVCRPQTGSSVNSTTGRGDTTDQCSSGDVINVTERQDGSSAADGGSGVNTSSAAAVLTSQLIAKIGRGCNQLEKLYIDMSQLNSAAAEGMALLQLGRRYSSLHTLSIRCSHRGGLTDWLLLALLKRRDGRRARFIEKLRLYNLSGVSAIFFRSNKRVLQLLLANLELLTISDNPHITDETVADLLDVVPYILHLQLLNCHQITARSLTYITKHAKAVRSIDIASPSFRKRVDRCANACNGLSSL